MAKKIVTVCTCDICGKETDRRFIAKFGVGNWDDDDAMDEKIAKDLCAGCYESILDLLEDSNVPGKKAKRKINYPKHRKQRVNVEEMPEFIKMFEEGRTVNDIASALNLTSKQVVYRIKKCKAAGYRRGILKEMGNPELERQPVFRTVVDSQGFVTALQS